MNILKYVLKQKGRGIKCIFLNKGKKITIVFADKYDQYNHLKRYIGESFNNEYINMYKQV